jgi:glucose/arabinose dehydrogenase
MKKAPDDKFYKVVIIFLLLVCMSIIILNYNNMSHAQTLKKRGNENKTQFYGCGKYGQTIHCDPLINKLESYEIRASPSRMYKITKEPIFVDGKEGKALEMHARQRESIVFANTENLNLTQFSISFWIKRTPDVQAQGHILSYTNHDQTAGWSFEMYAMGNISDQFVSFNVFNRAGDIFSTAGIPIQRDAFVHITGTFDNSIVKIYKDGVLSGTKEFNGTYITSPGLPVKIASASYCSSCKRWSGIIDDVNFYNKTLTENEVKETFFNNSTNATSASLIGHWTFDSHTNDISGNNNHGTTTNIIGSMAFTPDGRLLFTEKNTGNIRIMMKDKILEKPFATIFDSHVDWEQGLLGLTIDPNFKQNHFVYLYYTAIDSKTGEIFNRLVRFTDNNNRGKDMVTLIDKIPASRGFHSGGALAFGPDDKLYITVGDATEHVFAQDPSILIGKVLRINRDGTIPNDNPFSNSPVYTIGHRNMYGIAFDRTGNGIVTENGDYYYDEINLIKKGGNYGFPTLQPPNIAPELSNSSSSIKPLRSYWDTIAPTQAIYYEGDKIPALKGKFLLGTYTGEIYALSLDKDNKQIIMEEKIEFRSNPFAPIIGLAQSPDGDIFYSAYDIYKLELIDASTKRQILFPVEINSSAIYVKDLQLYSDEKKMTIDVYAKNNNNNNTATLSSLLTVKIPKILLDGIFTVTSSNNTSSSEKLEKQQSVKVIDFTIDYSTPGYTTINIPLTLDGDAKLSIIGAMEYQGP